MTDDLERLRRRIHDLDSELARLLIERLHLVIKIGQTKKLKNLPIIDENREKEVIDHVLGTRHESNDSNALEEMFHHIIRICRRTQLNGHCENDRETQ